MASAPSLRAARRDPERAILGGVCVGLARALGVDALVVRIAFVVLASAGGLGLLAYALAWALMPAGPGGPTPAGHVARRGSLEVAVGAGLLLLSALLALRAGGLWISDALVWPLLLVATGAALIWHRQPGRAAGSAPPPQASPVEEVRRRAAVVSRTSLGIALVIAAGLVFLQATGALSAARDVVLAVLVAVVVLSVIFAPWIVRLARSLGEERRERVRSQERAEMAAHLHDSVLQTLALVQKHAGDEREVAALARRQERELRHWLSGRLAGETRLRGALDAIASDVERAHGVDVDVVTVGDMELDERGAALVAAAREAIVNAAKFGGGSPVSVYAEAAGGRVELFVRDRGPGFDPAAVPADRRGVRESIVGRMERHGGRARIHTSAEGTEVELVLEAR